MPRVILSILLFLIVFTPFAHADMPFVQRADVQQFIDQMVNKYHFNKTVLLNLFSQVKLRPQVIHHVRKPLEKKPWHTYQMLFVNKGRIQHGVEFWHKYATVLKRAEETFGVPASIIVATIGVETKYGKHTGDYRVMDSLTNLGFSDSPRAPFFRKELEQFLLLTREEHLNPLAIMGSYAGAMGQPQFMPSSYRYYAVNFSKDGKIDLINNEADVIGSIANYYKEHGWKTNDPVAIQAHAFGNRYHSLLRGNEANQAFTFSYLAKYGIVPKNRIQHSHLKVKVIILENRYTKEYWLGYHNFDVIKRYNASDLYAMAVFQLSNHIKDLRKQLQHGQ